LAYTKVKLVTPIGLRLEHNISKTTGNRLHSTGRLTGNGLWGIEWPRDR